VKGIRLQDLDDGDGTRGDDAATGSVVSLIAELAPVSSWRQRR
jgi:hypothetical protein